jgi:hypothetical protein
VAALALGGDGGGNNAEAKPATKNESSGSNNSKNTIHKPAEKRQVDFKSQLSLGTLFLYEDDIEPKWHSHRITSGQYVAAAQGIVTVPIPPGHLLGLKLNARAFDSPNLVDGITPPDGLDGLVLEASSLIEEEDPRIARAIPHVAHLTGLKELYIDKSDVSDQQINQLPMLSSLERFCTFQDLLVKGGCLQRLSKFPKLKHLNFGLCGFDATNLAYLKDMKTLETLNISQNNVGGRLKYLTLCPTLKRLDLSSTRLTDDDLKSLKMVPNLEALDLDHNLLSDAGLPALAALKQLKWLDIQSTGVTAHGIIELLKKVHVESIAITKHNFSGAEIQQIVSLCPRAGLFDEKRPQAPTKEIQRLFAPITRHQGL